MSAIAGRVLLISKGDYSSAATYNTLDWVRYNNAAWVCKEDNVQNVPPSLSSTKWALMAADSAMSNLGDLNDVSISSEVAGQFLGCVIDTTVTPPVITWENVSADTTYSSIGTTPISGTGVADALSDYYTKAEIKLPEIFKYGGTKTGIEILTGDYLTAEYEGYVFRNTTLFCTDLNFVEGAMHEVPVGSLIAVIKTGNSSYDYYILCRAAFDEWNMFNNDVEEIIENSSTGNKTVTFHNIQSTDAIQLWADTVDGRVVKYINPTYDSQNNTYTITAKVTILPTKFYLRKIR